MLPTLRYVCESRTEVRISLLETEIARLLKLSSDDLKRTLPSGQQSVFANRLNWARSYLNKAGLLEATRRGFCRATPRAYELVAEAPKEIDLSILQRYPEFVAWRTQREPDEPAPNNEADPNPEDLIAHNHDLLKRELAVDLIARIHSCSPAFFERMIVDLLLEMGYGGGRSAMGETLGRAGDGGVDGVIKQGELGLDVIYFQAKRLDPQRPVPLRELRDFVGAVSGNRANKGVFVTTSHFPDSARDFIARVPHRIVLIDGIELARLMIHHGVGARLRETYEVKRLDEDYFAE